MKTAKKQEKDLLKSLPEFVQEKGEDLLISVFVKPNSKRDEIKYDSNQLIIYTKAPPSKNKANKSIMKIFANFLNISTSSFKLVSGLKNQDKVIRIYNYDEKLLQKIISNLNMI